MKSIQVNKKSNRRSGFALILAIAAMAFMVLLTLTLTTIISSKLRLLSAQKEMRAARSNAVLGMSVALSELQSKLGKDNAISFPAAILDTDPETPEVRGVFTPYVVGVADVEKDASRITPKDLQDEQRGIIETLRDGGSDSRVSWLISTEKRMTNPAIETTQDLSSETVNLAEYKTLTSYPRNFGGMVGSDQKNTDVKVKAGKVRFSTKGDNTNDGAYAWWVSDESMKAKINLTRPETYLNNQSTGVASKAEAPADSKIPQFANTSFVDSLSDIILNPFIGGHDENMLKNLKKMTSLEEMGIIDSDLGSWAKDNKGDWTANSVGIPVDVTQGRLKQDLFAYFEGGYGIQGSEAIVRGSKKQSDENYTGPVLVEKPEENLPRFGYLKDWVHMARGKDNFNDGIKPQVPSMAGSSPKHGIYPLISRVMYTFIPVFDAENTESLFDVTKPASVALYMWPRIWMWNPNNIKLEASDYTIGIYTSYDFTMWAHRAGGEKGRELSAATIWRRYGKDSLGTFTVADTNNVTTVKYAANTSTPHFSRFIETKADNGNPIMYFQVKNVELLPGEVVELSISNSATTDNNGVPLYKDGTPSSLSGSDNLMEPGWITSVTGGGGSEINILGRKGIKILMGSSNKELLLTPQVPTELVGAIRQPNGRLRDAAGTYEYIPSNQYTPDQFNKDVAVGLYEKSNPYFYTVWNVLGTSNIGSGGSRSYSRYGHELLLGTNQRLLQVDLSEWAGKNSISVTTNVKRYRHDVAHGFNRNQVVIDGEYWQDAMSADMLSIVGTGTVINYYGAIINPIRAIHDSTLTTNSFNKLEVLGLGRGAMQSGATVKIAARDRVATAYTSFLNLEDSKFFPIFGYRLEDISSSSHPIITGENLRASSLISGDLNIGATYKRIESQDNNRRNYGVAQKFSPILGGPGGVRNIAAFFGARTTNKGVLSWPGGTAISGTNPPGELISRYSSNNRGHLLFLSGEGGTLKYDYHASALFDYPRTEYDVMSLGMLSHANLSPMVWQPTYAFGESLASPYMDRDKITEPHKIYENELVDISYILNASMWDRFYISTIPQQSQDELKAGMRLPNTRFFLKSVPEKTTDLFGSDEAFKKSAAYVGVDGAFNVNSTSYEAWRAFLGGMLGTTKKTLTGRTINDETQQPGDPDKYRMPNPGAMNPIALPADQNIEEYSYLDTMVGRTISEGEIDQLAREIVAEVKRRAPFFSLSDFVNRRLIKASDATDLDKKYESLMGTLAAAIHRSTQDTTRSDKYFNSKSLEPSGSKNKESDNKANSYIQMGTALTIYDDDKIMGGPLKDLGEHVKGGGRSDKQYIEQAFGAPINTWNTRLLGMRGLLNQADILSMIGPFITVRGDTFTIRAYGESKNPMTGTTSKAFCEAIVQRSAEPVEGSDDIVGPESPFGRRFNVVSFRWLTPAEL